MAAIIDSSLWVDFTRARSPRKLKEFIAPYVLAPDAALAEPVVFEVLRHAGDDERRPIEAQFRTLPLLPTPPGLWRTATRLGQACRKAAVRAGSLDILIAAVALHHGAEIQTFDADFHAIATACGVRVKVLLRPAP